MNTQSRSLKRSAESTNTPCPSPLRRKTAEVFGHNSDSRMWEDEEEKKEMEQRIGHTNVDIPEGEEQRKPAAAKQEAHDTTTDASTPVGDIVGTHVKDVSATSPARVSTLRRKTRDLFSSTADPFDPDDDEYGQGSPSLHSSVLRTKAEKLFTAYRSPKNDFDGDEDDPMESSPLQTVKGRTLRPSNTPPSRRPMASINFASSPMGMDVDEVDEARSSAMPKTSTLRWKSADLFGGKKDSSSSIWDVDEEEFAQSLKTMRLDSSGRVRNDPRRTQRSSLSSSFRSTPSHFEQNSSSSRRRSPYMGAQTGSAPGQSTRASPLTTVFESAQDAGEESSTAQEGGPVRSIWDAEDAEFDRWPDKKDLEQAVSSFVEHRGSFKGISHIKSHRFQAEQDIPKSTKAIRGPSLTAQQRDDYLHELNDKSCGNPRGIDAHDEVMKQFYHAGCSSLPTSSPSNHAHLLDFKSYLDDDDVLVQRARPRLADAVVTVLYQTSLKCLADFLNPDVKIFEWRRDGNCVMIRREGKDVIVGTYSNFATTYLWSLLVRSRISDMGAWEEVYAGASQILTPVTAEGAQFDKFVEEEKIDDVDPEDAKYALHMGRLLGRFLLEWSVWDFREWRRWKVEWEADGVVVNAREHEHEALRMMRDVG